MKKYIDYLDDVHDKISGRERLEWANAWYDSTNKNVEKRVLLIGDSTVRMVRSTFAEKSGYAVDMLGLSSGLHDVIFQNQIDAFFASDKYHYSTIFVQIGHHSRIGEEGNEYGEADYIQFYRDMKALINFLEQYTNNIVLLSIFYSVIPPKKYSGLLGNVISFIRHFKLERYDDAVNAVKQRKNDIICQVANELGLQFCDINRIVMDTVNGRKTRFIHEDHVHLESAAKSFIVDEYMKYI